MELRATLAGLQDALRYVETSESMNLTGPSQQIFDPWVLEQLPFVWSEMARVSGRTRGPAVPLEGADWRALAEPHGAALLAMCYDLVAATRKDWQGFADYLARTVRLIDEELVTP